MEARDTTLPGVLLIVPKALGDARGFFVETYRHARYSALGFPDFVQDNQSRSVRGVLRGLHYQLHHPQGKLVSVVRGAILDVAVDIRRDSPNFGKWVAAELNDTNHHQLYVPPGFAHGFCTLSESADVTYKCTAYYDAADDRGVAWNDPAFGVKWGISSPTLSARDQNLLPISKLDPEMLPRMEAP